MALTVNKPMAGKDLRIHALIMGAVCALAGFVLIARLYVVQIAHGDEYVAKSTENYIKETRIPADRGQILDRKGRLLVDSRASYDVWLTPAFCPHCLQEVLPRLQMYLSLSSEELSHIGQQYRSASKLERFRDFPVKIDISPEERALMEFHAVELPGGVEVKERPHRAYLHGTLLAHALGYMSEVTPDEMTANPEYQFGDFIGRAGIERAFEDKLRGKDGMKRRVVDSKGTEIRGFLSPELEGGAKDRKPVPGYNAVLSIDERLQEAAEKAFPAQGGAVVALDPRTGFVLALVSRPEYDPNKLTGRLTRTELAQIRDDPFKQLLFRPIQAMYHPGSTFKPVTALAALTKGEITLTKSTQTCTGAYRLGNHVWRCFVESGHGTINLTQALTRSCDYYFYHLGDAIQIDAIADAAKELGLGAPTGFGLDQERPGVIPTVEYHNKITPGGYQKGLAVNTAVGQGDVNITPMQQAVAYAAIANGGTVYRPQIVKRIEDVNGRVIKAFEPEIVRHADFKPEYLHAVVEGLIGVVNDPSGTAYGSVHRIAQEIEDVVVAGKTGTAQVGKLGASRIASRTAEYLERDHAWFASFAPAENPEIVVVVVNEHGGFGGHASAPTALEVIKTYFQIKAEEQQSEQLPEAPEPASKPKDEGPPQIGAAKARPT
jgi:penicillin-binding protein 2